VKAKARPRRQTPGTQGEEIPIPASGYPHCGARNDKSTDGPDATRDDRNLHPDLSPD
jgi:hypothetical protein